MKGAAELSRRRFRALEQALMCVRKTEGSFCDDALCLRGILDEEKLLCSSLRKNAIAEGFLKEFKIKDRFEEKTHREEEDGFVFSGVSDDDREPDEELAIIRRPRGMRKPLKASRDEELDTDSD
ncbi:hypothetical protein A9K97_gp304 [Tokyovirus A1]|uniref:hypothetical protein n=1 Tax=Tokyovirus A1 TaxID=1826170 RepID=UPI0007A95DD3|nr:hypothetical protein A9K97_gp304 [Tokyovirus A1]BAU80047.1 hypothetical protein [Tokyovirus A1]